MRSAAVVCLALWMACGGATPLRTETQYVVVYGAAWKAEYRLTAETPTMARLEGWAVIKNTSSRDWFDAKLTLTTGVPADSTDQDHDGVPNRNDLCGLEPEDKDDFEDGNGCPEADNDQDRWPDEDDKCPNDPETYNGFEDEDGCPDRVHVPILDSSIAIVDRVFFATGSDAVKPVALPLVDAIAATLVGNPSILVIEVQGHTSRDERDVWSLSTRRAAAVRAMLIQRGVAPERLQLAPYGNVLPADRGTTAQAQARNRRVDFVILERGDPSGPYSRPVLTLPPARTPPKVADPVRYPLAQLLTLPHGQSTRIAILDKRVPIDDGLVFTPRADVPGSEAHPFRAIRIVNTTGFVLQPGTVELASGGRAWLERTDVGQAAWLRSSPDRTTKITSSVAVTEKAIRILAVQNETLTLEATTLRIATYDVTPGRTAQLHLHHPATFRHEMSPLPANVTLDGNHYVQVVPLTAGMAIQLVFVESQPTRIWPRIGDLDPAELTALLDRSTLPRAVNDALRTAVLLRTDLKTFKQDLTALRKELATVATAPLSKASRVQLANLATQIGVKTDAMVGAQNRLDAVTRDLVLPESAAKP